MAGEPRPIDVTDVPELRRLAEEVSTTNEPRLLCRGNESLAVGLPVRRPAAKRRTRRALTEVDLEAFRSAAGSWQGVDVDAFLDAVAESRRMSSRPAVEL